MRTSDSLLKILLVDDEPIISKGLEALIDWEEEGFCIAGKASNGNNAILLLNEDKYDLIISDIKMPEMDGIEFLSNIRKNKISEARFVFLSGFYDFTYAKSAIKYGCCDYVLKPIQREELLKTLRKIMNEYQKEADREMNKKVCEKAYLDHNLLAILWGKYDLENLLYVRERMRLTNEVTYIHFEIFLKDEKFAFLREEKKREQQRKLYHYAGLLLKNQADHIIFDVNKNLKCYDIGLVYCDYMSQDKNMSREEWIKWFLKELSERIGYEIVACVGSNVKGIEAIAESYREATITRFFRYFQKQDNNTVFTADKKYPSGRNSKEKYYKRELDELIHSIDIGDKSMIKENVKSIYGRMMDKDADCDLIGLNIQYLFYGLLGLAYEQDANINQEEVIQYISDAAYSSGTLQGNEGKFLQFAEEFSDYMKQLRQTAVRGSISQIEAEIEAKYADNLSLKSLGEKYYINSAYLGQVFKKRYGCTFKDYLNGVRIRKAAEILLRTDEKVYEIAEKVGYKNLEYFINKFEAIYGATPTRFRKRNITGDL